MPQSNSLKSTESKVKNNPFQNNHECYHCKYYLNQILETIPRPFRAPKQRFQGQFLFSNQIKDNGTNQNVIHQSRGIMKLIKFGDPIPTSIPKDTIKRRKVAKYFDYYSKLKDLFTRKPIWNRKIIEKLPVFEMASYMLSELLPFVAYCYTDGPWKGLWCRYGYNPTTEPSARIYQIINIRISGENFKDLNEK